MRARSTPTGCSERVAVPAPDGRDPPPGGDAERHAGQDRAGLPEQHRLVADASHELRTPLTVMRAELDVSLRGDDLTPAAREVLESAREEVDRMRRTVDNLLTLAAADDGGVQLLAVRCDLRRAMEEAARRWPRSQPQGGRARGRRRARAGPGRPAAAAAGPGRT